MAYEKAACCCERAWSWEWDTPAFKSSLCHLKAWTSNLFETSYIRVQQRQQGMHRHAHTHILIGFKELARVEAGIPKSAGQPVGWGPREELMLRV